MTGIGLLSLYALTVTIVSAPTDWLSAAAGVSRSGAPPDSLEAG
jgi:hypothetical protein